MSGGQQVSAWPEHSWLRLQAKGLFRYPAVSLWRYSRGLLMQNPKVLPRQKRKALSRLFDDRYSD